MHMSRAKTGRFLCFSQGKIVARTIVLVVK